MARRIEKDILDIADSIFTANFCLGYFRYVTDAPQMMRLQKIEDLKQKNLWNGYQPEFINETIISLDNPDFGINIYAVGAVRDNRSKTPEYSKLLDLTSTHINFGGHRCCDFVCTLTNKHNQIELIEDKPPSNEFVLGNGNTSNLRCNDTSISSLSDRRDKTDIVDLPTGLNFLNTLRPVKFKWQTRDGNIKDGKIRAGFIAQELQEAQKDFDFLDLVMDNNPDKLEAKQEHLIPVLVQAIKELSAEVEKLKNGS